MENLNSKSILELISLLKNNQITSEDLIKDSLLQANKYQKKYNAFVTIIDNPTSNNDGPLMGIPYVLKDNFSTKNILTTASSNILKDYIPVFDSTVYEKLTKNGGVLIGKTVLDELAMGGSGISGHTGIVYNPYDKNLNTIAGGSSAGSAVSVALGIVPFSIGSDTGDSVRKPAAFCGIVGFKPTYGRISRYGLFPFAPSLDHVGYFTRTVEDSAFLLSLLEGNDEKDSTSSLVEGKDYLSNLNNVIKGKKIAVIKEIIDSINDKTVLENFNLGVNALIEEGAIVEYVNFDFDLLNAIYPTYMIISSCEATSNNANLDGIKFGIREQGNNYIEMIKNTRTKGFGKFIKRRFVLGSYALLKDNQKELFLRAQKIRRLIVNKTNEILNDFDVIMLPASGDHAPTLDKNADKLSKEYLIAENHLAIANFAGLPSITIPSGFKNKFPIGINFTSKAFDEQTVFDISFCLQEKLNYKNMTVKEEN